MAKYTDPRLYEQKIINNMSVANIVEVVGFKERIKHILLRRKKRR